MSVPFILEYLLRESRNQHPNRRCAASGVIAKSDLTSSTVVFQVMHFSESAAAWASYSSAVRYSSFLALLAPQHRHVGLCYLPSPHQDTQTERWVCRDPISQGI